MHLTALKEGWRIGNGKGRMSASRRGREEDAERKNFQSHILEVEGVCLHYLSCLSSSKMKYSEAQTESDDQGK